MLYIEEFFYAASKFSFLKLKFDLQNARYTILIPNWKLRLYYSFSKIFSHSQNQ